MSFIDKKNTPRKIYSDSFHGISLAIKLKIISNVDTKNNTGWFSCHLELWKLKRIKIRISFQIFYSITSQDVYIIRTRFHR